jgi:GNAT superfamily N-acetyltransferase
VNIRRATTNDAGAAAEVYIRARRAAVPAIPPMAHPDDDVRAYWAAVLVPRRETWVAADDGGAVIGVLVLDDDWVDQLYIAPGDTGNGIGSALLAHAKEQRPEGLRLWTFQSNTGARRFYERHGFVATDQTDGDNEEQSPDVLYVWKPSTHAE